MRAKSTSDHTLGLRQQAERMIQKAEDLGNLGSVDTEELIHELCVHRAELEMQYEELQRAYLELQKSRDQYADLYDFAPVGYLTLNEDGQILEANQTIMEWLGVAHRKLIRCKLSDFLAAEDQDTLFFHLMAHFKEQPNIAPSDVQLKRQDGSTFNIRLLSILKVTDDKQQQLRITLTDVTQQKQAEAILNDYHAELERQVAHRVAQLREANETLAELAVIRERQRIAIELHDAVSQSLWSASVIAESLPNLWEKDRPKALEKTHLLAEITRGTLAEMRALLLEIRPEALETTPLDQSLSRLVDAVRSRTELDIRLQVEGEVALSPEIQTTYYRVAQEAIANAVRYSQATQIRVILKRSPTTVRLTVRDNGKGFDVNEAVLGDHHGLSIMRERAKVLGAQLKVKSTSARGSTIEMHYDLKPE